MSIPPEILAVERPSGTKVKKNGNHYDVIKRTSVYKDGRRVPKDLGKVGEIVDGKYVPRKKEAIPSMDYGDIDILDYGRIGLCHRVGKDILDSLRNVFSESDSETIYSIALLRSAYGNITDRDLKYRYDTSYLSVILPDVSLSEARVCRFLEILGGNYLKTVDYMKNVLKERDADTVTVVDGMLKDTTGKDSGFVQWSRKSRLKGTKEISILYAFDLKKKEPLCHKVYPGNMLDMTSFSDFIDTFDLRECTVMGDKGFLSAENLLSLKERDVHYVMPLKRSDSRIGKYALLDFAETFRDGDDVIEAVKKNVDGLYYYCYRSSFDSSNERRCYLANAEKKKTYDSKAFGKKESRFGIICFVSDQDLDPKDVYSMYDRRWEIETFFGFYKNIVSLSSVRVQGDRSIIGTEFINMLSSVISSRVKKLFIEKELNRTYSYSQIMSYLDQPKKIRKPDGSWADSHTVKYIQELKTTLGI